MSKTARTPYKR